MLKKDITFQDLEGNPVTETHYFHLSKADLIELQLGKEGGFEEWLKRVVAAEDGKELIRELKGIILMSYGVKSEDGKRFVKSEKARQEFANSEAFAELFSEIALDADAASAFVNAVIPHDLSAGNPTQTSVFDKDDPQPDPPAAVAEVAEHISGPQSD